MKKLTLVLIIVYAISIMMITWIWFPLKVVAKACCSADSCKKNHHHDVR